MLPGERRLTVLGSAGLDSHPDTYFVVAQRSEQVHQPMKQQETQSRRKLQNAARTFPRPSWVCIFSNRTFQTKHEQLRQPVKR